MKNKFLITIFTSVIFLVLTLTAVSAVSISSVSTNPDQIAPGQTAIVTITIRNTLNEEIKNVNVALDFSDPTLPFAPAPSGSGNGKSIDKISSDDEESVSFDVIVQPKAASGVYKIPVIIAYLAKNNTPIIERNVVSVVVYSAPKLTIAGDGALIQGVDRQVTINVVNNGLSDVKLASIEAGQPSGAIINPPIYEYLGSINSDDSTTIQYILRPTDINAKSVSLPLTIKYKDSNNKDFVTTQSVKFPVYTQQEAISRGLIQKSNAMTYVVVIVLLIILYLGYRFFRRRKKRAKEQGR